MTLRVFDDDESICSCKSCNDVSFNTTTMRASVGVRAVTTNSGKIYYFCNINSIKTFFCARALLLPCFLSRYHHVLAGGK